MLNQKLVDSIELDVEMISMKLIESVTFSTSALEEARLLATSSINLQSEVVLQLCDRIEESIASASNLVHSLHEVGLEESALRLRGQITSINTLLDRYESRKKQ